MIKYEGHEKVFENAWEFLLSDIGTLQLGDREDVFFVTYAGNTMEYHGYKLLNVRDGELLSVDFSFGHGSPYVHRTSSPNLSNPAFQKEREFLNKIVLEYGHASEDEIDANNQRAREKAARLEAALKRWDQDHRAKDAGTLTPIYVKGEPALWRTCDTNFTFDEFRVQNGCNKGEEGVITAYSRNRDAYFVIFHPADPASSFLNMSQAGDDLIIKSDDEGTFLINMKTFKYRRQRAGQKI